MNRERRSSGVFAAPALLLTLAAVPLLLAVCSPPALAAPPEVTNAVAAQRPGTNLVDVTYDLYDPDGDAMTVALYLSPDGGQSFPVRCVTVSGDVGEGVTNGTGRHIEWDAEADYPDHAGDDYVVKVTADDGTGYPGMIWIPAGNVRMGQTGIAEPVHDFYVEGFNIDALEVSNGEYKEFIDAGGYTTEAWWNPVGWAWRVAYDITLPDYWDSSGGIPGNEDFPVKGVSWFEADAYCRWAGGRLPTEAEWEKAAKGGCETHGDPGQCDDSDTPTYPWGEGLSGPRANYWESGDPYEYGLTPVGYYDGSNHGGYQTIDSPSPYGLYDVAGNLFEWCSTRKASYPYDPNDGRENPPATWDDCCWVLRGGSWAFWYDTTMLRCADRAEELFGHGASSRDIRVGFRCARTAPAETGWGVSPLFHLDTIDSQASIGAAERAQGFRASVAGPNIFTERLALQVALPGPGALGVTIIDAAGRHVRTLVDAEYPAGTHMLVWDGSKDDGQSAPAGVYFVRSSFHGRTEIRRAMLIR
jgi:formylglycine-generating enzyme required for sulfatase activity